LEAGTNYDSIGFDDEIQSRGRMSGGLGCMLAVFTSRDGSPVKRENSVHHFQGIA